MTDHKRIRTVRAGKPVRRADIILVSLLLVAATLAGMGLKRGEGATVTITADGVTKVYDTAHGQTILVGGLTVTIAGGTVRVTAADCPDKRCTRLTASKPGDLIVCLPNNVVIQITGTPEVDISVG